MTWLLFNSWTRSVHKRKYSTNAVKDFHEKYLRTRFEFGSRRDFARDEAGKYIARKYSPDNSRVLYLRSGCCGLPYAIQEKEKYAVDSYSKLSEHVHQKERPGISANRLVLEQRAL